ncbi:MAG: exopolyphosphatase, partial [Proteobacteria bacterium]
TISAIGTGGNINAAFQLAGGRSGAPVSREQIEKVYKELEPLDIKECCARYGLKPDRADVLSLGLDIYVKVMKWANCMEIHVPMVGLCDGIISMLYDKHHCVSQI